MFQANCRAGAFNHDGSLVATGSVDASIKILDVDRYVCPFLALNWEFLKINFILSHYRMLAKSQIESMASGNKTVDPGSHPVIRTLYDHMGEYGFYRL